jgi:hypothetical protein
MWPESRKHELNGRFGTVRPKLSYDHKLKVEEASVHDIIQSTPKMSTRIFLGL